MADFSQTVRDALSTREYGQAARNRPPVLFLHGSGQRGDDLALVRQVGIAAQIDAGRQFPFIIVPPQCRNERSWESRRLLALLDHIEAEFAVDADRIYVTGFELGGYGTWNLAATDPARFAATAPVGGLPGDRQSRGHVGWLKGLAVWEHHGMNDRTAWFELTREMIDKSRDEGGWARVTVCPERHHESWAEPYCPSSPCASVSGPIESGANGSPASPKSPVFTAQSARPAVGIWKPSRPLFRNRLRPWNWHCGKGHHRTAIECAPVSEYHQAVFVSAPPKLRTARSRGDWSFVGKRRSISPPQRGNPQRCDSLNILPCSRS